MAPAPSIVDAVLFVACTSGGKFDQLRGGKSALYCTRYVEPLMALQVRLTMPLAALIARTCG
jgi:hypothetical protein